MSYLIKSITSAPDTPCKWDAWENACTTSLDFDLDETNDFRPATHIRMFHDRNTLYGLFRVDDRYVVSTRTCYQDSVCSDSCVEFFFKPSVGQGYFNLEMNAGGTYLFYYIRDCKRIGDGFADYSPVDERYGRLVSVKTSMPKVITPEITMPTTWYVQFAIPTAALEPYCGPIGALAGQHWTCNFYKCAGDSSHSHYITWSPIPECNFHLPNFFAPIDFE